MTMMWMRMPGQTWPGAAASFLGMWIVMMMAMMLPSLIPMLLRYRKAVGGAGTMGTSVLTAILGAAYFFVWTVFGIAAFTVGAALMAIEMEQPALARTVPIATAAVVLAAGAFQFTRWKVRQLACCREMPGHGCSLSADAQSAWSCGLRLGVHCCYCCAGLMTLMLVLGVMDIRVTVFLTAAITVERLASRYVHVARAIGVLVVGLGLVLIVRTL